MGRRTSLGTALLTVGSLLSSSATVTAVDQALDSGLRRKRSSDTSTQYKSRLDNNRSLDRQNQQRRLTEESERLPSPASNSEGGSDVGEDLARKFFLPTNRQAQALDDIDMQALILEMNFDGGSMSFQTPEPTPPPTVKPTISPTFNTYPPSTSTMPTLTNCNNEGTCENRLAEQIMGVSVRVGTVDTLSDPNSPQSQASAWILEECNAEVPIDPCTSSQLLLNEQRYALAVMYFSLTGDGWNAGSNSNLDPSAPAGTWMSGLNYCDWGTEISGANGSYNQLVCDEFGNVLNLNLRKYLIYLCGVDEAGVMSLS